MKTLKFRRTALVLAMIVIGSAGYLGYAQDQRVQIKIVGSSTVYPFATYVAEEFGKTTRYPTPAIESTGSGGGHKLWGAGLGFEHPDLTNSSRKMKISEFMRATRNFAADAAKGGGFGDAQAATGMTEAVIGSDGIVLAQHADNKPIDLTIQQLTLAVAAKVPQDGKLVDNPYNNWNQIDSELPDRPIKIFGPPSTSGTRDAFEELCMEAATEHMDGYEEPFTQVRSGAWIDSGEQDNLIVQQLAKDRNAFGIFGYSFLDENRDKIQAAQINGVEATPDAISSGKYPLARSLYFYVKHAHVGKIPGLRDYLQLFMSEKMIGKDGYLTDIGLIPLPAHLRKASQQRVLKLHRLGPTGLRNLEDYAAAQGFTK
jgi:phosphate transport system substrate-binding protein